MKDTPTILIVDDNKQNVKVIGNMLKKTDYRLAVALSGTAALQILNSNPIDLILLDVMMPEIDGFEVCRRVKSIPKLKDIPIIFITALANTESIIKGFELGGVDYITKPFKEKELLIRVKTHLDLKMSKEHIVNQNEQLNIQNELLSQSNATKDKIFSIVAHDLRGPLGAFPLFFEIVDATGNLPEMYMDLFAEMKLQSEVIFNLLENLLSWARSQQDTIEFKPENLSLYKIVDANFQLLSGTAKRKSITLTNKIIDNDFIIIADKNILNLIFRNLISNALKFTPQNGSVIISAIPKDGFVEVSVRDTGIGISKESQEKLFNNTVYHTTRGTNAEKGTGLGFNMCVEFVKKHGGEIRIESEFEKGSDILFTVPTIKQCSD